MDVKIVEGAQSDKKGNQNCTCLCNKYNNFSYYSFNIKHEPY